GPDSEFLLILADKGRQGHARMPSHSSPAFLFASPDPALLGAVEPVLVAAGAQVEVVLTAQGALAAIAGEDPPGLVLLDENLPGMPIGQLIAAVSAEADSRPIPVVLIADGVTEECVELL